MGDVVEFLRNSDLHEKDVDEPALLKGFFEAVQACLEERLLLAYHDRGDGAEQQWEVNGAAAVAAPDRACA